MGLSVGHSSFRQLVIMVFISISYAVCDFKMAIFSQSNRGRAGNSNNEWQDNGKCIKKDEV